MIRKIIPIIFMSAVIAGCGLGIEKVSSIKMPGADLERIEKIYVNKLQADGRGLNLLIKKDLIEKGYQATTEEDGPKSSNVDAVLAYLDRWKWDLTTFMYQLTIYIKDPEEKYVLGAGKSFRNNFSREDHEIIVREVLDSILEDKK